MVCWIEFMCSVYPHVRYCFAVPVAAKLHQKTLQWRHSERNGVSNHQRHNCLSTVYLGRSNIVSHPWTSQLGLPPLGLSLYGAGEYIQCTWIYSTNQPTSRSKKTSELHVTGLCEGNSPVTGELPTQRASTTENISIWWRHHDMGKIERYQHTTKHYQSHAICQNHVPWH